MNFVLLFISCHIFLGKIYVISVFSVFCVFWALEEGGWKCAICMLLYYLAWYFKVILKVLIPLRTLRLTWHLWPFYGHIVAIYGQTGQDDKNVLSAC